VSRAGHHTSCPPCAPILGRGPSPSPLAA
jgi:hypothetical protein